MMHTDSTNNAANAKVESMAAMNNTAKEVAPKRDALSERMTKRGDTRRRLEDLMMSKESKDLW